ncbi:MAG: hypothetical protein ABJQ90_10705 [Parasphingorhabdus sp.]
MVPIVDGGKLMGSLEVEPGGVPVFTATFSVPTSSSAVESSVLPFFVVFSLGSHFSGYFNEQPPGRGVWGSYLLFRIAASSTTFFLVDWDEFRHHPSTIALSAYATIRGEQM